MPAGRYELRHHGPAIRDKNMVAGPNRAHYLAQAILELSDADRLHEYESDTYPVRLPRTKERRCRNVAARSHIVNSIADVG